MRKILILTLLSAFACISILAAREPLKNATCLYGYHTYIKETLNSIQADGTAILEGTQVRGLTRINGILKAKASTLHALQVNGQAELNNCLITNGTSINGFLDADKTEFQQGLSIASQKVILRGSTADSLTIREVKGFTGKQVVYLRNGTVITGPIVFESGNGELWVSLSSKISEDLVSGGQIYRK
jgi:hypothetical protein